MYVYIYIYMLAFIYIYIIYIRETSEIFNFKTLGLSFKYLGRPGPHASMRVGLSSHFSILLTRRARVRASL